MIIVLIIDIMQVKVMQDNISGRGLDIPLLGLREGVSVSVVMRSDNDNDNDAAGEGGGSVRIPGAV